MKQLIKRLLCIINQIPYSYKKVWYNQSIWLSDMKYPVLHDENNSYIPATVGLEVIMRQNDRKTYYYKVSRITRNQGGDWYYDSDAINVDLTFSRIETNPIK